MTTNTLLELEPATFHERFGRKPFRVRHRLSDHPLFALPRLLRLATALPEDRVEYNSGVLPVGANIEIGVRPEFVNVAAPATGLLSATIDRIDDLGRVRFARVRVGDVKFAARVPPGFSVPDNMVGLVFDPGHVHVYADSRLVEGAA